MNHASLRFGSGWIMLKLIGHKLEYLAIGAVFVALALSARGTKEMETRPTAHDHSNESVRQLWEAAVAAKGGRERLRGISSLFVKADMGDGDHDYALYVFPDYKFEYS